MNKTGKIITVAVLIAVVGIVIAMKQKDNSPDAQRASENSADVQANQTPDQPEKSESKQDAEKLPHLIDLGAGKCVPCKMMKPILEELKQDYNQQFKITFIDVWKNEDQAKKYDVKMIPTQIFYDASGEELFRHEGFYSKEDILSKWEELGIEIQKER
ncbi:thioredoxin family protein [Sedimentisphaera salicampi]|uniref:thioredoxin family protein n=1 Tax=Sedimentisphaera salicampi TaxID=1941349 RepID=UPI000B9C7BBA|nr:thioredoxin family protein [Sedimentisphaera salicampi]OXU14928.1 Thioredoxin C-2 [Sedimentisphaera salicampi]